MIQALHEATTSNGHFPGRIGVITPYKSQAKTVKDHVFPWLRMVGFKTTDVEVNTVDAFQGREKDIILINCVRAND